MPIELLQFIAVLVMCGVIWVVQLVHYPGFAYVDHNEFVAFHRHHTRKISMVVIPTMVVEWLTGAYLLFAQVPSYGQGLHIVLFAILAVIWLSTFLVQAPLHSKLKHGKDSTSIKKLVATNWVRTIGWTARAAILAARYLTGELSQGLPI